MDAFDSHHVGEAYAKWADQAERGLEVDPPVDESGFSKLFVLGLGGSAAAGDIVAGWLQQEHAVEVEVCKGVLSTADMRGSMALACSASGNTEETISMMKTAAKRGATIVAVSSGGRLARVSAENGIPHVAIPHPLAPRYGLPSMLFVFLRIVDKAWGLRSDGELRRAVAEMRAIRRRLTVDVPLSRNPAKALAQKLLDRTPVIYGTRLTKGVGVRFKNAVNENAKKHAMFDEMPELFHNEAESWTNSSADFRPVLLRDGSETPRESALIDAFHSMLARTGNRPIEVSGEGDSVLTRLVTMTYLLDFATFYLAIGLGRDPFPIPLITSLKRSP